MAFIIMFGDDGIHKRLLLYFTGFTTNIVSEILIEKL